MHCPRCERQGQASLIERRYTPGDPRDQLLVCPVCGWQATWGEYHRASDATSSTLAERRRAFPPTFQDYTAARTPQAKMIAVDRLIHEFHYSYACLPDQPTRPVGVNLIEGKLSDVIDFLNSSRLVLPWP